MNTPGASVTGSGATLAGSYFGSADQAVNGAYVDPATPGPSVTLTTQATVLVWMAYGFNANGVGTTGKVSVTVSGATTLASLDANGTAAFENQAFSCPMSRTTKLTLTPGSNTLKLQYAGTNITVYKRGILVLAL